MEAGISELTAMGATTEQGFTYKMTDNDVGYAYMKDGVVVMEVAGNGSVPNGVHESSHGFDLWKNGSYDTADKFLNGEVKAYGRQFSFNSSSLPKSYWGTVTTLNDISQNWVIGAYNTPQNYINAKYLFQNNMRLYSPRNVERYLDSLR